MAEQNPRVFRGADGNYYTQSLFLEASYETPERALYTTKRQDYEYNGILYLSFPRLYLEIADPTEYQVAERLFDGWPHWQRIWNNSRLTPMVMALREELEIKLRSEGVRKMIESAKTGKSDIAAKWLSDKGWENPGKGRPTNAKIKAEAKKLQAIKDEIGKDADRLRNLS